MKQGATMYAKSRLSAIWSDSEQIIHHEVLDEKKPATVMI
jgi:hypothetical protein